MATGSVFICYRRDDGAHARNLYDRLTAELGEEKIYIDVERLDGGVDFQKALDTDVAECALMVVVIGKGFLALDKNGMARIHAADDFVRREIKVGLQKGVPIIPVCFDIEMPTESELPDDISALARNHALKVYHDAFEQTIQKVVDSVAKRLEGRSSNRPGRPAEAEPTVERRPRARKGNRGDNARRKAVPPAEASPNPQLSQVRKSEELIEKVAASHMVWGVEGLGGRMVLTNQRVLFEAHTVSVLLQAVSSWRGPVGRAAAWIQSQQNVAIPLSAIESVVPSRILGIVPVQITIRCHSGEKYRFKVWGRKEIVAKIETCRQRFRASIDN